MNKSPYLRIALLCLGLAAGPTSVMSRNYTTRAHAEAYRPQFVYNVDFGMNFDNREYGDETFAPSGTIFGARLAPSVGFVKGTYNSRHTLMAGADFFKDFGDIRADGTALFREAFFYYGLERRFDDGAFSLTAGIFPRSMSRERWSTAFFSEKYMWYHPYMEGMLMSYERARGHVELGCDWIGMHGASPSVKEQFMLFSSGRISPWRRLRLGYSAYMMHLANSAEAPGVADNFLGEAYAELDLGSLGGIFHEFTIRAGYLQSLQRDREVSSDFAAPGLGEVSLLLSRSGFGAANSLYYGKDLMTLYDSCDAAGEAYGERLYFNDPFLRMRPGGGGTAGSYDRLEVFYAPQLGRSLQLKFSAVFHFNNLSFSGCQQLITLRYNL